LGQASLSAYGVKPVGIRDSHSTMKVNVMHGAFQKNQDLRNEFLTRLGPGRT
jgi:GTP cyclohydrolase I